jgi:hypothetical protein
MSPADTHLPGRPISGIEIIVLEIFTEYLEISRQVKTSLSAHIAERNLFFACLALLGFFFHG